MSITAPPCDTGECSRVAVPSACPGSATLVRLGRGDQGIAQIREALGLDPSYAPARMNLDNDLAHARAPR